MQNIPATPPDEYVELFRHIDIVLNENVNTYRWLAAGKDFNPFSTLIENYDVYRSGF